MLQLLITTDEPYQAITLPLEDTSRKTAGSKIVDLTQNYIAQHIFEKSLNLKQAAADLHVNYYYLSKSFKAGTGISFTEYVNNKRLQIAAVLLSTTQLHVYEICEQIGMEPKNFHGLFRKHFHMTPQEYRRQNVSKPSDI